MTPENEQPDTPEVATQEQQGEAPVGRAITIEASTDELKALDDLGPDDPMVKEWLAKNNVTENDQIIIGTNVYEASSHDFLTRNLEATKALEAASIMAARSMVGETEDAIDAHTAEIIEEEPRVTLDEVEKIGDKGLEAAEVEDPSKSEVTEELVAEVEASAPEEAAEAGQVQAMHRQYENRVFDVREETATGIAKALNAFEENQNVVGLAERTIIGGAQTAVSRLEAVVRRFEDYPVGAVQAEMQQTIDALYHVHRVTRNFGEETLSEVKRITDSLEATLVQADKDAEGVDTNFQIALTERGAKPDENIETAGYAVQEAIDAISGIQELRTSVNALDTVVGELSSTVLGRQITELEERLRESYQRPVNVEEIAQIIRTIQQGFQDGEAREAIKATDAKWKTVINQVHKAYSGIKLN